MLLFRSSRCRQKYIAGLEQPISVKKINYPRSQRLLGAERDFGKISCGVTMLRNRLHVERLVPITFYLTFGWNHLQAMLPYYPLKCSGIVLLLLAFFFFLTCPWLKINFWSRRKQKCPYRMPVLGFSSTDESLILSSIYIKVHQSKNFFFLKQTDSEMPFKNTVLA